MQPLLRLCLVLFLTSSGWSYTYILNKSTGLPVKWDPGQVTFRIGLGSGTTLTDGTNYNTSAQAAAQIWNGLLGNVQFVTQIGTTGTVNDHNRSNEMAFGTDIFGKAFGDTTLAVTTTWLIGNQRNESDVIFNSKWTWDSYRGPKRTDRVVDLQRVAIHELGHSLGLDHPDEAEPPQSVAAVMNSHISDLESVTTDDITGAQNLYGPPGVPANDKFADAIPITLTDGVAKLTGYNTNATKEPSEPRHADNAGGHSVWWKWTAPSAGAVNVDTRGSYSDTALAIYTGTTLANLTTIASNDDIQRGIIQASSLTFTASGGTLYYIAVDGFDADSSGLTLNLSFQSSAGTLPSITSQPVNVAATAGTSVSFAVTATAGTSPITYQWFFGSTAVSGATTSTLSLSNVQSANAGSYFVAVTTAAGTVNSMTATLTVNELPPAPVVITPTPTPAPSPSPSAGGGGGGAPSLWFCVLVTLLGLSRRYSSRR